MAGRENKKRNRLPIETHTHKTKTERFERTQGEWRMTQEDLYNFVTSDTCLSMFHRNVDRLQITIIEKKIITNMMKLKRKNNRPVGVRLTHFLMCLI